MSSRISPASTILTGGVGSDSQKTSVAADRPAAGRDTAEVDLVGDRAGPAEQLAVDEQRGEQAGVVLVQPATDPGVVAQEHVAGVDARAPAAVAQRPVGGHVQGRGEFGVVQADLHDVADLVHDRGVEVVAVGHDDRPGHPLERLAHLLGDRGEAVPDDLVGQRVERVDDGVVDVVQPNGVSDGAEGLLA